MKKYKIAIIGATGLVGERLINLLTERNFPIEKLYLYASKRSAGKSILVGKKQYKIRKLTKNFAKKVDFTFFMTSKELSKKYLPYCKAGYVIDNSSEFRLNSNVPLVVPEINFYHIKDSKIIANPNCTTAICSLPLKVINDLYGIDSICATTYQSVSGCGYIGINALKNINISNEIFGDDICSTCISKIGKYLQNGYTDEEEKFIYEIRKIFDNSKIKISSTCVRVPINYCHAIALQVTTINKFDLKELEKAFKKDKNIEFYPSKGNSLPPTSTNAHNSNKILVGRLRSDFSKENTILLYVVGDNLMRGAAYNAYKIMERIVNDSM